MRGEQTKRVFKLRKTLKYSIIVPVFNRPDEVDELLKSLTSQTYKDFEVIVVEDGSTKTCKDVCDKYADILSLHYYYKENSGPGQSRNCSPTHGYGTSGGRTSASSGGRFTTAASPASTWRNDIRER